ncbi:MAG: gliding motility protein RemB, partial [Bacteroidia bacterium]|nr:gliding motility protein RemB [Bacteroidia bacterium]
MKKLIIIAVLLAFSKVSKAQEDIYPVYSGCNIADITTLESCFNHNITKDVLSSFAVPEKVINDKYKGSINVIFLVNKEGRFEVLYVRSDYKELEEEARRVFANLPKAIPATYNGRAIEMRFGMPISIPFESQEIPTPMLKQEDVIPVISEPLYHAVNDKTDINKAIPKTSFPEHHSELNIPFTHQVYNDLSFYYDQNENSHTAFKPYQYSEASKFVDLDAQKNALIKPKASWGGKKLWNEHFFKVQEKDFWFTINPVFDLQIGKDNSDNIDFTYNNTRAIQIQGGLGKNLN